MKSKNINVFKSLSKDINEYIKSQSHLCVDRKGKNDIVDALLYKLLYTQANTTQEISTIKLNILKKKYKKNISSMSSRQSLAKKENRSVLFFLIYYDQKIMSSNCMKCRVFLVESRLVRKI